MEDEIQVSVTDTETKGNQNPQEDFSFFNNIKNNNAEAKKHIDKSAEELTDFIDSLSQDVIDLSEDEINSGIEKILQKTHPQNAPIEISKNSKNKKISLRVLFIAALLALVSFSCICVVGNSNSINIENGFISIDEDGVRITFFGENKEKCISVESLLISLEEHGYKDILLPQQFITGEYKVTVPEYVNSDIVNQVSFTVYNSDESYAVYVTPAVESHYSHNFTMLDGADTLYINNIYIYMFESGGNTSIEFIKNGYKYSISSTAAYEDMCRLAESIK